MQEERLIFLPRALSADTRNGHPPGAALRAMGGPTMGTSWSVKYVDGGGVPADLEQRVRAELDTVIAQMSTWAEESDLSRFNAAPGGSWHELPAALFTVLEQALHVARDSGGAFDPTIGPLVNAWGFGPDGSRPRPSELEVQAQRARVGWQRLELDAIRRRALQPGGAYVDLSGIAKGYAVDAVARCMRRAGVKSYLVEIGGELFGHGVKPGMAPWWVALDLPGLGSADGRKGPGARPLAVLDDLAIATSGDYRRYVSDGEGFYSHTIDPRNGRPIASGLASVSVLHPECMVADAMATALTVLGVEAGHAWAAERGLAALFIERKAHGYTYTMTPNLAAMMEA